MCVENVFYDEYPDGKLVEFRRLEICQYGQPSRPCFNLTVLENPPRYIRYGELTTQAMLSQPTPLPPRAPHTPPRSPHRRSGSNHRNSGEYTSDEGRRPRRNSGLAALLNGKKLRQHRKERIVIVESPPTPRTPPMRSGQFPQVLTAPSSPSTPPYIVDSPIGRGRPIIVDERPLRRERAPSVSAVVGERLPTVRARSQSFSERVGRRLEEEDREDREREERRRRRKEREAREAERDVERRLAERIALQNEEILRRPAVPMPPRRLSEREYLRPVIDQSGVLQNVMGSLTLDDRTAELAAERRRREEREALIRARMTAERLAEEEEALKQRLKERQQPNRRFSVGPGHRRHRVLYDDGVYRWE